MVRKGAALVVHAHRSSRATPATRWRGVVHRHLDRCRTVEVASYMGVQFGHAWKGVGWAEGAAALELQLAVGLTSR